MSYIGNTSTTQAFTPAIDYFSGNGSTTAFTLSRPVASVAQVQVTIDNVAQNPSSAFTVSANTITFTSAPLSGTNNIYVYYTSPITQVIAPGQGTVTATSMASSTGTGAGVFQTSPTITTPVISSLSSASATALTLQSAGTTAITVDTSQNVGIGSSSPAGYSGYKTLTLNSTSGGIIEMQSAGSVVANFNGDSTQMTISTVGSKPIVFKPNNTEAMRIESSGNLLVGTTIQLPGGTSKLVVDYATGDFVAGFRNSNASPLGLYVFHSTDVNASTNPFIYCVGGLNVRFSFRSNGGIANFSANNVNLSDRREKINFAPAKSYLNTICSIPVQTFNYIDQSEDDPGLTLGVVAQDVQAVAPEMVTESNWGTEEAPKMRLSIYQTDLQYALMKSIQELKAINDTQAETINALTARIVALENR